MAYEEGGEEQQPEQRRMRKALMEQLKRAQVEEQKKQMVMQLMESTAYDRLMNVKAGNYELYSQLVNLILSLSQQGRLQGRITEKQLIDILQKVTARHEPTVEFKHK